MIKEPVMRSKDKHVFMFKVQDDQDVLKEFWTVEVDGKQFAKSSVLEVAHDAMKKEVNKLKSIIVF